jgi:hypothetical protein
MATKNSTIVILSVDQNGEPIDMSIVPPGALSANSNQDIQIKWTDGVPNPATDPEGFKDYLHKWHLKNNPTHFKK